MPNRSPDLDRCGPTAFLLAAALISTADGMLMVALPFLALSLGGEAGQVGLVGGLLRLLYVIGLLAGRPLLDRFKLSLMAICGCLGLGVATLVMPAASSLPPLFVTAALYGAATSLFWPPVVGLLFSGFRGRSLNRRLGQFNMAWSGGMIIGPWVGGELFNLAPGLPFWVAVGMFLVAAASIGLFVRKGAPAPPATAPPAEAPQPSLSPVPQEQVRVFHRLAMVALVGGYVVLGLLRYQLPNLAEELDITTATFGRIGTVLSLSLAGAFYLLGKVSRWHYRAWLLWSGQVIMAASLLILLQATSARHLALCTLIAGQGIGLVYSSHLFYGSSAGSNRARVMTRHEVLLSIGFLLGAYGGGLIADLIGNRTLYLIAFGAILAGVVVQVIIRSLAGGRSSANTAHGTQSAPADREA